MSIWLLVVTVKFTMIATPMHLELPPETVYTSPESCRDAGIAEAAMLTQDGTNVEWKCVEVPM